MNSGLRKITLMFLLAFGLTLASAQENTQSQTTDTQAEAMENLAAIRFAHLAPDAGTQAVDIFIDGQLVFSGSTFGTISEYFTMPAGTYDVRVAPSTLGATGSADAAQPANQATDQDMARGTQDAKATDKASTDQNAGQDTAEQGTDAAASGAETDAADATDAADTEAATQDDTTEDNEADVNEGVANRAGGVTEPAGQETGPTDLAEPVNENQLATTEVDVATTITLEAGNYYTVAAVGIGTAGAVTDQDMARGAQDAKATDKARTDTAETDTAETGTGADVAAVETDTAEADAESDVAEGSAATETAEGTTQDEVADTDAESDVAETGATDTAETSTAADTAETDTEADVAGTETEADVADTGADANVAGTGEETDAAQADTETGVAETASDAEMADMAQGALANVAIIVLTDDLTQVSVAEPGQAFVRVVHLDPATENVTIAAEPLGAMGGLADPADAPATTDVEAHQFDNLTYAASSEYTMVPAGRYMFDVTPATPEAPLADTDAAEATDETATDTTESATTEEDAAETADEATEPAGDAAGTTEDGTEGADTEDADTDATGTDTTDTDATGTDAAETEAADTVDTTGGATDAAQMDAPTPAMNMTGFDLQPGGVYTVFIVGGGVDAEVEHVIAVDFAPGGAMQDPLMLPGLMPLPNFQPGAEQNGAELTGNPVEPIDGEAEDADALQDTNETGAEETDTDTGTETGTNTGSDDTQNEGTEGDESGNEN